MPKKIMVIEDELDLLKIITFRIKKSGYEIITATDGNTGIALIEEHRPDLILLDLRIPGIDGWEVCRRIKGHKQLCYIPVILLSASVCEINDETVKQIGAQDYLRKPFEPQSLIEKIKKLIG